MSSSEQKPASTVSSSLNALSRRIFPSQRNRKLYFDFIAHQYQDFDVRGVTTTGTFLLSLAQIFVEPNLNPKPSPFVSTDPIRPLSPRSNMRRLNLWVYLNAKKTKDRNLVILGPPGSGKTTLLKHLTLALAVRNGGSESAKRLRKVPLLLFLQNHVAAIANEPDYSLTNAVTVRLSGHLEKNLVDWLTSQLKRGGCLVMLDGLDEVADPDLRMRVVEWIDRQKAHFGRNQFIISSRPFGYRNNPLRDVVILELQPFNVDQVQQFVNNWYLTTEMIDAGGGRASAKQKAEIGAEDLMWQLRRTHALLDMAVNPLLLTMIATIHRYRGELPGHRVDLYDEIVKLFLGGWQSEKDIVQNLSPQDKQPVLEFLAHYMMTNKQREILAGEAIQAIEQPVLKLFKAGEVGRQSLVEDFLKDAANTGGLLVSREGEYYRFAHITFQEYLTAVFIRNEKREQALLHYIEDDWWHDTIRLYTTLTEATNVVKLCLSTPEPSVAALTLALECLSDARDVKPDLQAVFDKLVQSVEHENIEIRQIASEVLLSLRLRRLVRLDENRYLDASLVTKAEYQLFLDQFPAHSSYFTPDHWIQSQFPAGQGRTPISGVRPIDALAFCEWLTGREASGGWYYRLPNAHEIRDISHYLPADPEESGQVGYWYQHKKGYRCTVIDITDEAWSHVLENRLDQRILYDWALEDRVVGMEATLKNTREMILARAWQRQFSILDFNRDHGQDFERPSDIPTDLELARDRTIAGQSHHLDLILTQAVERAESLDVTLVREIDLADGKELIEAIRLDLDQLEEAEAGADICRQINRQFEYSQSLIKNQEVIMNPELIRALSTARQYTREATALLNRAVILARARVRSQLLARIVGLRYWFDENHVSRGSKDVGQERRRLALYIDMYLDFALIEERINQRLPAFEGILIVRQRS